MSIEREEKVICPKCGKEGKVIVWDSLNADIDPWAKERLINGELFSFKCECGYSAYVDFQVLYNDMTHNVMVYYVKEDKVPEIEDLFRKMQKPGGIGMPDKRYRIVTDQNTLREKATIFDLGLDDRIMELLKTMYLIQAQEQYPEIEQVFFYTLDDRWVFQFIGGKDLWAEPQKEQYDSLQREYSEILAAEGDKDFYVDYSWTIYFLRRNGIIG